MRAPSLATDVDGAAATVGLRFERGPSARVERGAMESRRCGVGTAARVVPVVFAAGRLAAEVVAWRGKARFFGVSCLALVALDA